MGRGSRSLKTRRSHVRYTGQSRSVSPSLWIFMRQWRPSWPICIGGAWKKRCVNGERGKRMPAQPRHPPAQGRQRPVCRVLRLHKYRWRTRRILRCKGGYIEHNGVVANFACAKVDPGSDAGTRFATGRNQRGLCHADSASGGRAGFPAGPIHGGIHRRLPLRGADSARGGAFSVSHAAAFADALPSLVEHCFKPSDSVARLGGYLPGGMFFCSTRFRRTTTLRKARAW